MIVEPFEVIEPETGETPMVVEVPHSGILMDPRSLNFCAVCARSIAADADLYVDELAQDAPVEGAALIYSRMSRYVLDLNRNIDDVDRTAVIGATRENCTRGLIWTVSVDERAALSAPLPRAELQRRIADFYKPYHSCLEEIVERKHKRFGVVIVLSLHSMPSVGRCAQTGRAITRADVVIGTQSRSTAASNFITKTEELAKGWGLSVAHDDPYKGGATTVRMGRPKENVHAIQVELARRLYMDERSLERHSDFGRTRSFCRALVAKLGEGALG
jgi:N-formylglutamate amidohydrolase